MCDGQGPLGQHRGHKRRPHAQALRLRPCCGEDPRMRLHASPDQRFRRRHPCIQACAHITGEARQHGLAGDFACACATHAVGQHKEPLSRVCLPTVFIATASRTGIGTDPEL